MERVETDRELVARCQGGDETAFTALVTRHQHRALNVAYQLLRNHEDAVEVAQDAFVSIYRNIGRFRGECEFTTWLHRIVVNLARNKQRWWQRRGRPAAVSLDDPNQPQFAAVAEWPDAQAAQAEFVGRLHDEMGRLPAKFREVLVLRNVEELSYDEIAVALRCSVGTVKSRIARAREELRRRLQ
jgi:RNA polymerase sigma-70 factor (ECF subfamily)